MSTPCLVQSAAISRAITLTPASPPSNGTTALQSSANTTTGATVTLKLKTADFKIRTRTRSLGAPTQLAGRIFAASRGLLEHESAGTRFRLLGVGVSALAAADAADPADLVDGRSALAEHAVDSVRARFGETVVDLDDPYRFPPVLSDFDLYLLGEGTHQRIYDKLGAHPTTLDGVPGKTQHSGQFIDDDDDARQGCAPWSGAIAREIAHAGIREEAIAPFHLGLGLHQRGGSILGRGDDRRRGDRRAGADAALPRLSGSAHVGARRLQLPPRRAAGRVPADAAAPFSYTPLTLPTNYSV